MNFKVYIQAFNGFPVDDWALSAYLGFRVKGTNIIFFEDIEEVPVSRYNIIVSNIEDTNKYLEKLGIGPKMALNIPEEIEKYAMRDIHRTTMAGIRHADSINSLDYPFFIKGNGQAKVFVPGVVKDSQMLKYHFSEVSDYEHVMVSTPVDFASEYRCYVINNEIKGIYHYRGDIFQFPDVEIMKAAVKDYKSAPVGYSMDFGIVEGITLLVECNDGWSLGNYGLNPVTYSTLLAKRWLELVTVNRS